MQKQTPSSLSVRPSEWFLYPFRGKLLMTITSLARSSWILVALHNPHNNSVSYWQSCLDCTCDGTDTVKVKLLSKSQEKGANSRDKAGIFIQVLDSRTHALNSMLKCLWEETGIWEWAGDSVLESDGRTFQRWASLRKIRQDRSASLGFMRQSVAANAQPNPLLLTRSLIFSFKNLHCFQSHVLP